MIYDKLETITKRYSLVIIIKLIIFNAIYSTRY